MDTHIVCGAIVAKDGKILMVQEGEEKIRRLWNNPAGHLDIGESIIDGTIREVKEETGFDVKLDGLIGVYYYLNKEGILVVRFQFRASVKSGILKFPEKEIMDAKWFAPEEILAMDDSKLRGPGIKPLIRDFISGKLYPVDTLKYLK